MGLFCFMAPSYRSGASPCLMGLGLFGDPCSAMLWQLFKSPVKTSCIVLCQVETLLNLMEIVVRNC